MSQTSKTIMGSFKAILMTIVIGLLLVSLAIWGVADAFTPKTKDAAAMVGDNKITLVEFDAFFRRQLRDENRKATNRLSTKQAYNRGFHGTVLNQLITENLIQLDADTLGVDVNRADARRFVEGLDVFNNVLTGKLDEAKLAQRLAQSDSRQSRKQFERDIRKALRQEQTMSSIVSGIQSPTEFADQQYKFMLEARTANLLRLTGNAIEKAEDPSDEVLKEYIAKNPNPYIAPEYRQFTLLRVEVEDYIVDMEASDEEIADQFDYKIKTGKLGTQETRSLTQLVSPTQEKADLVTAALNDGTSIAAVVTQFELDDPIDYSDIFADATHDSKTGELAFTLAANTAQTLEGSFGTWYSVMTTGITPAIVPDLKTETPSIALEIKTEKAQRFVYDLQDSLQSALSEGKTIEDAAKTNGVSAASFDFMARTGALENGEVLNGNDIIAGVAKDDAILKEIFLSEIGYEGDIFETSKKGIAAIRVDARKDSAQRPFDTIRDRALGAWHIENTTERLDVLLDTVADRITAGETLDVIAADLGDGVNVQTASITRIQRGLPDVSQQTNARLFEARIGRTIRGTGANGIDRIIGSITEIEPHTELAIASIASTLEDQASTALNDDIQRAYHAAMLKANPTQILSENIKQILGVTGKDVGPDAEIAQ